VTMIRGDELRAGAALIGWRRRNGSAPARRRRGAAPAAPAFSREFNGTTDELVTAAGLCPDGTSPVTYLAIWRPLSVKAGGLIAVQDVGDSRVWGVNPYSDGQLYYGASGFTSMPYSVGDGWVLDGFSRPAGGAQPVTGHHYVYSSGVWTHPALGTVSNGGNLATTVRHGFLIPTERFHGRIAVEGVWPSILTNGQVETVALALAAWSALSPAALWPYNQASAASPLLDVTGNGADQISASGTTVSADVPPGFVF